MARMIRNRSKDSLTLMQEENAITRREQRERYDRSHYKAHEYNDRAMDRVMDMRNSFYAGLDPRRRQEAADAGLVTEDPNAMANLPRMAQHHEWPTVSYYDNPYIDDLVVSEPRNYFDYQRED